MKYVMHLVSPLQQFLSYKLIKYHLKTYLSFI